GARLHDARGGGAQVVVGLDRGRLELVELALAEHGPPVGSERLLLGVVRVGGSVVRGQVHFGPLVIATDLARERQEERRRANGEAKATPRQWSIRETSIVSRTSTRRSAIRK